MKIFKSILFSILYTAIYLILQAVIQLVMLFVWGYNFAMENLTLTVIVSSILAFLIYWGIIKLRKQKLVSACNFIKFDYRLIPALMVLGFCLQYLLTGLILILGLDKFFPEHEVLMKLILEGGNPVIVFFSVAIAGPFIEEIIFRGLVINELKGKMPFVLVIIIQALLFGVIHGNWLQIIYASILGILLGLVSTWSRSIWPAIILHISMNGTPFLSELLWDANQIEQFISSNKIPVTVTSGIIVIVIMYFIYRKKHTDSDISTVEIPEPGII